MTNVTGSEVAAWINLTNATAGELAELQTLADVSTGVIAEKVYDPTLLPVHQAIVMHAARIWKRKNSPEGTIEYGDMLVSVKSVDADIEALYAPFRKWSFGKAQS